MTISNFKCYTYTCKAFLRNNHTHISVHLISIKCVDCNQTNVSPSRHISHLINDNSVQNHNKNYGKLINRHISNQMNICLYLSIYVISDRMPKQSSKLCLTTSSNGYASLNIGQMCEIESNVCTRICVVVLITLTIQWTN